MRALAGLWPFVRHYKVLLVASLLMLTFTALISLILPLAVRRIVDGFDNEPELLDRYFLAAIGIAMLLAIGSALRLSLIHI